MVQLGVEVKVAWWVMPYLLTLCLFASALRLQPDSDKVVKFLLRWGGIKVKPSC